MLWLSGFTFSLRGTVVVRGEERRAKERRRGVRRGEERRGGEV